MHPSITKQLVEEHHGRLHADATPAAARQVPDTSRRGRARPRQGRRRADPLGHPTPGRRVVDDVRRDFDVTPLTAGPLGRPHRALRRARARRAVAGACGGGSRARTGSATRARANRAPLAEHRAGPVPRPGSSPTTTTGPSAGSRSGRARSTRGSTAPPSSSRSTTCRSGPSPASTSTACSAAPASPGTLLRAAVRVRRRLGCDRARGLPDRPRRRSGRQLVRVHRRPRHVPRRRLRRDRPPRRPPVLRRVLEPAG